MKLKALLFLMFAAATCTAYAQDGGIRGKVVSRTGREALGNVQVTIESSGQTARTASDGTFVLENLPKGDYTLKFSTNEYEPLDLRVRVDNNLKDLNTVVIVPYVRQSVDDAIFAELDTDSSSSDVQALPSSLNSSKDLFSNIASYRFSEMRFNVRGLDSQNSDVYLNGIRFNDAMTGYGPWSLWSGLNDATRNQESVAGLASTEYGLGGVGGVTNINARASQMRKGFRASVSNGNQMYRFRAMVSYASGQQDNGWAYAFSVGTRQGGNGYVDGVYYNSYSYFASVEKVFNEKHRLSLTLLASPSERGAQQASTDEAYKLFGNNYYNPNVGYQNGKLRNSRVRIAHEPIVMLNYSWDISDRTRLTAATSFRFGSNGYSALSWNKESDPRGDYYRYLPSNYINQILYDPYNPAASTSNEQTFYAFQKAFTAAQNWNGMLDYDRFYNRNNYIDYNPGMYSVAGDQRRSNIILEERHTDQLDYNFATNVAHNIRNNQRIIGGVNLRVNRTSYFDEIKDLMGGNYWYDIDKFADRDMPQNPMTAQNDLEYYNLYKHAPLAKEGDKFNYYYRAHLLETRAWARYTLALGGFSMGVGGEIGYSSMYREGMWRKGLFPNDSKGKSESLDYLVYNLKGNFSYKFSGAHSLEANVTYIQDAPKFASAFVSPRTRNSTTPGLSTEKTFGAELTYNLNLPYIKARVTGYYTTIKDRSKVISFYDDQWRSFTNFAMSGIDERHYGVEFAFQVPIYNGLSAVGAVSWGDYTYTSDPYFQQTVDNVNVVINAANNRVRWNGFHVESSPQTAVNIGLDYRGPRNWFASVNFNYYANLYLSMNPYYRTDAAVAYYQNIIDAGLPVNYTEADVNQLISALGSKEEIRAQEKFDGVYTLAASIGKNWYIHRQYMIGFSLEVKNILNNQDIRTGGYEQMRMNKIRTPSDTRYTRFDSKYFYMLGTNYYLNLYFRF